MLGNLVGEVLVAGSIYLTGLASGVDVAAGRQFAQANCARCHAVEAVGASPIAAAPPFRTLARQWPLENLEEALAEGIFTGHPEMPEFELTTEQIENFIGYLETIQQQ